MNITDNKRIFIAILFLLIAAGLVWTALRLGRGNRDSGGIFGSPANSETTSSQDLVQSLNGTRVEKSLAEARPLAVVVENHPDSRPQSGLSKADLVYETLAEGGITRFLAVYQTQKAENIGPIRSARTYFADIANELGAVFAHVGGNSDALENLKTNYYPKLLNIDEFFNGSYFHRTKTRLAPHNAYSSTEKLESYAPGLKLSAKKDYSDWLFADDFSGNQPAEKISIDFSQAEYKVGYEYDPGKKAYKRFLAGSPHLDAEGQAGIYAKNVIVQSVKTWPVKTDTLFSISLDLTGGGQAFVFSGGKMISGSWRKASGDRTRYYDGQNKEIELLRGTTWVELVPIEKMGELKWSAPDKQN